MRRRSCKNGAGTAIHVSLRVVPVLPLRSPCPRDLVRKCASTTFCLPTRLTAEPRPIRWLPRDVLRRAGRLLYIRWLYGLLPAPGSAQDSPQIKLRHNPAHCGTNRHIYQPWRASGTFSGASSNKPPISRNMAANTQNILRQAEHNRGTYTGNMPITKTENCARRVKLEESHVKRSLSEGLEAPELEI